VGFTAFGLDQAGVDRSGEAGVVQLDGEIPLAGGRELSTERLSDGTAAPRVYGKERFCPPADIGLRNWIRSLL
jgi:hypothetical protein